MAETTNIAWTDATFNPWRGCTKVSAGCTHCYAETLSKRNPGVLGVWGDNGTRVIASEAKWKEPERWNAKAEKEGVRKRVFCASLADVFEDRPELVAPRIRLFDLIRRTPWLDWQLLTKRPENINRMIADSWNQTTADEYAIATLDWLYDWRAGRPPANVWLGTTVEDKKATSRIDDLLNVPARVRFLSMEPLLERVNISLWLETSAVNWVITGGESGPKARPFNLDWADDLRAQCKIANVAFFMKQMGDNPFIGPDIQDKWCEAVGWSVKGAAHHGANPAEWPSGLRLQQFPTGQPIFTAFERKVEG